MESFLVYLFNFYYAISELEQNKQNNTIIFFLLFIFLTKKWTSAVCGEVRAHPSHPPSLRTCLKISRMDHQISHTQSKVFKLHIFPHNHNFNNLMGIARGYKFDVLETKASETLEHQPTVWQVP